jgi:hypothetical protein
MLSVDFLIANTLHIQASHAMSIAVHATSLSLFASESAQTLFHVSPGTPLLQPTTSVVGFRYSFFVLRPSSDETLLPGCIHLSPLHPTCRFAIPTQHHHRFARCEVQNGDGKKAKSRF